MKNPIGWLKQIDHVHAGKPVTCPKYGSKETETAFFMFPDRIGFGDMICKNCGDSVHISRMKFPDQTKAKITHVK